MKIAIVHDELIRRGGAEQFTLRLHKAFPDAPIYTSCFNLEKTYPEYETCDVRASWLSPFIKDEKVWKRIFYPFGIWAMKSIRLKGYDLVLISTTSCAKFVKVSPQTKVVAFCHYPFRLAWFPESYTQVAESKGIMKMLYRFVVSRLKRIDFEAAQRIDHYITNTADIGKIINQCYQPKKEVRVVPSSIVCRDFYVEETPANDYFLIVSRLEPYKKVNVVIEAFNRMPDKKLIIVGRGSQKENYQKTASKNIEFLEGLSKEEIAHLYANCKAFIFPQEEDFGLTPIEANASGKPVIAFGKGGVLHTTVFLPENSLKSTSYLFFEQTSAAITQAISQFEKLDYDPGFIRKHAEQFDESVFVETMRKIVSDIHNN